MKARIFLLIPCILLSACQTALYDGNGKKIASFRSDITGLDYARTDTGAVSLKATTLNNSTPTVAAGKAITPLVMAATAASMMASSVNVVNAVRKPIP